MSDERDALIEAAGRVVEAFAQHLLASEHVRSHVRSFPDVAGAAPLLASGDQLLTAVRELAAALDREGRRVRPV
jgi:hypothetical protein